MTILIAGDSFSTDQDFRIIPQRPEFYSWVEELKKRYPCVVNAVAGSSNWNILKQLDCEYSYAIVNLSNTNRVSHEIQYQTSRWDPKGALMKKIREAGEQYARRILSHPRCYFWSPWPVYETWPEIDYLELKGWNEIWLSLQDKLVTGSHLTREGNDWMINHMSKIIEENA